MKLIVKDRGVGKTYELMYTSSVTGYPIVCYSKEEAKWLKEKANLHGIDIPDPIGIEELRNEHIDKRVRDRVLVDDVQFFLEDALSRYLGVREVVAATCSPNYTKEEWDKWNECADKHERPNIYNVMLDL